MSVMPPSPLSYTGEVATPFINKTFPPLPANNKFSVPTIWVDTEETDIYILARNEYVNSVRVADWIKVRHDEGIVEGFKVDAFTAPGTDPVIPIEIAGLELINITGGQVAAGTTANVIQTNSLAANTLTIQVQRSSAQASTTIGANGVSHFNSAHFSVDSNGYVTLLGGGQAIDSFIPDTGTSPVVPNISGQVTITGLGSLQTIGGTNTLSLKINGLTQYAVVCGGDPSTGALQSVSGVGTTGQVLTSNGAAALPTWQSRTAATIKFSARKSANTTNATGDGTTFTIVCDTVAQNIGSGYNGTTGVFTAPEAGLYFFTCIVATSNTDASHTVGLVNFAGHAYDSNPYNMAASSSTGLSLCYSQILLLNAADTVDLSVSFTGAGATKVVTVQGGSGSSGCFFSGFLIG